MLKKVGTQSQTELSTNGKEVFYTSFEQTKYSNFEEYANCKDQWMLDTNALEDKFWDSSPSETKYAINNELSLFGDDVQLWNLNQFDRNHSNIHETTYYRSVI